MCVHVCVSVCVCACVCACVSVCVHVCTCVCMWLFEGCLKTLGDLWIRYCANIRFLFTLYMFLNER